MKPDAREKLSELFINHYTAEEEYFNGLKKAWNKTKLVINILRIRADALEQFVIDEAEKPKYACPNCQRIVDEIITQPGRKGFVVNIDGSTPNVYGCKHCLNKK